MSAGSKTILIAIAVLVTVSTLSIAFTLTKNGQANVKAQQEGEQQAYQELQAAGDWKSVDKTKQTGSFIRDLAKKQNVCMFCIEHDGSESYYYAQTNNQWEGATSFLEAINDRTSSLYLDASDYAYVTVHEGFDASASGSGATGLVTMIKITY